MLSTKDATATLPLWGGAALATKLATLLSPYTSSVAITRDDVYLAAKRWLSAEENRMQVLVVGEYPARISPPVIYLHGFPFHLEDPVAFLQRTEPVELPDGTVVPSQLVFLALWVAADVNPADRAARLEQVLQYETQRSV